MPDSARQPQRLVLLEESSGDAELLSGLLTTGRAAPEVVRFSRVDDALRHLAHVTVDCVLLGLPARPAEAQQTLQRMLDVAPRVPVVVLMPEEDEALGLKLIRTGAQDYVVKGAHGDGRLARAVRHAIERRRTGDRAEVARLVRDVGAATGGLPLEPDTERRERRDFGLAVGAVLAIFALQMALGLHLGGTQLLFALPVAFAATRTSLRRTLIVAGLGVVLATIWSQLLLPSQLALPSALVRAATLAAIALATHRIHARSVSGAQLLRAVVESTTDFVFVRDLAG